MIKNSASSGKGYAEIKVFDKDGNLKKVIPKKSGVDCGWNSKFNASKTNSVKKNKQNSIQGDQLRD